MEATAALVLPIIPTKEEEVVVTSENEIDILKKKGKVSIEANVPLSIRETKSNRFLNMVPGMEALPTIAHFSEGQKSVVCTVRIG